MDAFAPFTAEIRLLPFGFAPHGWARCDGLTLPINQNTALFSLIGNQYGGDGKTTFQLPTLTGPNGDQRPPSYYIARQGIFPNGGYSVAPFVGEIRLLAFNFAPDGWARCNGQILEISEYPALYPIIGILYGGDGQTTFGLPNLTGPNGIDEPPFYCLALQGATPPAVGETAGAGAAEAREAAPASP
jgi:microcystin-dependent protein